MSILFLLSSMPQLIQIANETEGTLPLWARIALIVFFLVVIPGSLYYNAKTRKALDLVKEKPSRIKTISTLLPPTEAAHRIVTHAPTERYKVEDVASDSSRVVLSTPVGLFSYGFFFPIYFTSMPDGSTSVEVGVTTPVPHRGFAIYMHHNRCLDMVSRALA